MSEEISSQFTHAEQALNERIDNYVFAPKFSPAVGANIGQSYDLLKEDLEFQSSLGKVLQQQQSIINEQGSKQRLAEKAVQDQRDAENTNAANTQMIRLMGKGMSQAEAFRSVTEQRPELLLNPQFTQSYNFFKTEFEDDDEKKIRLRKEILDDYGHEEKLHEAEEKKAKRTYEKAKWDKKTEAMEVGIGEGWEDTIYGARMKEEARRDAIDNFTLDGSLSGNFQSQNGGSPGASTRRTASGAGQDPATSEFGDLDDNLSPQESAELMGYLDQRTGIQVDDPNTLLRGVQNDWEAGFIQTPSSWTALLNKTGIPEETIIESIQVLSNKALYDQARQEFNDGVVGDATTQIRNAKQIIKMGGNRFLLDHKEALAVKREADRLEAVRKEAAKKMSEIVGSVTWNEKFDALGDDLYQGGMTMFGQKAVRQDLPWSGSWTLQGLVNESSPSEGMETKTINDPKHRSKMHHALEDAWSDGAELLTELIMKMGLESQNSHRDIMQMYEQRLRYTPEAITGSGEWKGISAHSPTGYVNAIKNFIAEVATELHKPKGEQRFLVPLRHRLSPQAYAQKGIRNQGLSVDTRGTIVGLDKNKSYRFPEELHDPQYGYIFMQQPPTDPFEMPVQLTALEVDFLEMLKTANFTRNDLRTWATTGANEKEDIANDLRRRAGIADKDTDYSRIGTTLGIKEKRKVMDYLVNPLVKPGDRPTLDDIPVASPVTGAGGEPGGRTREEREAEAQALLDEMNRKKAALRR